MALDILIATAVLSGLSGSLAVLLLVAEHFFANYGDCEIDVNDGTRTITVKGGSSLLRSLNENKILVPSACGGRGSCGVCKVKVLDGGGPVLPTELPYLNPDELKNQTRLSCQVKVKNNLRVRIPEEILSVQQYVTTLEAIVDLTHDIKGLRFRLPEGITINFQAGQYMQLMAPAYGDVKEATWRAYSMSNAPSDNGCVELCVRLVPNGILTTYVFNHMKEGQQATLNGPYGDFYLRTDSDREIICIAGGSGLAPIKSIVQDMLDKGITHRKTRFFFGARGLDDLYYTDMFGSIAKEHDFFEYIPALSAPDEKGDGGYQTGLITDVVARHYEKADHHEAYLCGSPGMIDACVKVLTGLGMPEEHIHYDKFS